MENIEKIKLIDARMHEISDMLDDLNAKYRKLERERFELIVDELKSAVGMCLKTDDEVIRITDVPRIEWDNDFHMHYGQKMPCLIVTNDNEVFTDFLECHFDNDPVEYLRSNYDEISNEEFEKRLMEVFEWMRSAGVNKKTDK